MAVGVQARKEEGLERQLKLLAARLNGWRVTRRHGRLNAKSSRWRHCNSLRREAMNTNLEPPCRVKHSTIPVSAFKPEAANDYRPKVLRRFEDELPIDCSLRVEDERDGKFVLWAHYVSISLNVPEGTAATITPGAESLDQTTVDKIEVAPVSNLTHGCDFVIFQDSPEVRAECQHKGQ